MFHSMNAFTEIALIIILTIIFMIIGKFFSNIKIKEKRIKVPIVISVIAAGFFAGLIMRSIDPEFQFDILPYFSTISTILLFLAFGAKVDYKAFKKFGVWTIILGAVPYIIEWIVLTIVVMFLTPLLWMEAGLIIGIVIMCVPAIVAPKLTDNISKGYEKENNYNETVSLAGAIENIFGLVIMIIMISFYGAHYNPDIGFTAMTILSPFIILIIGVIAGVILAIFTIKVLKPIAHMIVPSFTKNLKHLKGEELEKANNLNLKSERKSNNLLWVFLALLFSIIYVVLQIEFSIGFIVMEMGLVTGIVISIFGSKSLNNEKSQKVIAADSNIYYQLIGCFLLWGFGGMLINPGIIGGNDWMVVGETTNFMPNIITALIFCAVSLIVRIIGIFFTMSFSSEYTLRQKIYTVPVMMSKGTAGINNGVMIFLLLGISGMMDQHAPGYDELDPQTHNALILQHIMIVTGALMTFIFVPIGVYLLEAWQNKYIFKWNSESEGTYKSQTSKLMSIESTKNKKEVNIAINEYWTYFYKDKKVNSIFNKKTNKKLNSLVLKLDYYKSLLRELKTKRSGNIYNLDEYIESEKLNLAYSRKEFIKYNEMEEKKLVEKNYLHEERIEELDEDVISKEKLRFIIKKNISEIQSHIKFYQEKIDRIAEISISKSDPTKSDSKKKLYREKVQELKKDKSSKEKSKYKLKQNILKSKSHIRLYQHKIKITSEKIILNANSNKIKARKIIKMSNLKVESHKVKIKNKNLIINRKIESINNKRSDMKKNVSIEKKYIFEIGKPQEILDIKKILKEKSIALETIINSSIKDKHINQITKELFVPEEIEVIN